METLKDKGLIPGQKVQDMLNKSRTWIWRQRKKGMLTAYKIGGRIYFLEQDIEKYIDNSKEAA